MISIANKGGSESGRIGNGGRGGDGGGGGGGGVIDDHFFFALFETLLRESE